METKRLFFGMEIKAPWPEQLPMGRHLDPEHRHMTLAFLGKTDVPKIEEALKRFPQPNFKVGFTAKFDQCLFLPPKHPRVIAWHSEWLSDPSPILDFQKNLIAWLLKEGFSPDTRHPFMPHVTVSRAPFNERVWSKKFIPLPLIGQNIHLYESVGQLRYSPIWTFPLLPPFEEVDHTADLAFLVRGADFNVLYQHAFIALAFHFPPLLSYLELPDKLDSLEDVIIALNHTVSYVDQAIGAPFKAVSFHNHMESKESILHWEMIVDV